MRFPNRHKRRTVEDLPIKSNKRSRILGLALIHSLDMLLALGRLLSLLRRTSIILQEPIAHLAAPRNRKHLVLSAMLRVPRHGLRTARASPADLRAARQHRHSAEVLAQGARQDERHGGAVAEARGEAQVLIDAKVVLDGLDDVLDENDVLAATVPPADAEGAAEARGRDVDGGGGVVDERRETIVGVGAAGDLLTAAAYGVHGEDQTVGVAGVIVGRELHEVLARLAARGDAQAGRGGGRWCHQLVSLSAAGGWFRGDDRLRGSEQEQGYAQDVGQHVEELRRRADDSVRWRWLERNTEWIMSKFGPVAQESPQSNSVGPYLCAFVFMVKSGATPLSVVLGIWTRESAAALALQLCGAHFGSAMYGSMKSIGKSRRQAGIGN